MILINILEEFTFSNRQGISHTVYDNSLVSDITVRIIYKSGLLTNTNVYGHSATNAFQGTDYSV